MVDRFDIKRDGGLLWNPTGGSVRYADYKALETEHRLYHRDWVAECEKNKSLQTELREAKKEIADRDSWIISLEECLNGSSKAVYTAEVFDKMRGRYEAKLKVSEDALDKCNPCSVCYKISKCKKSCDTLTVLTKALKQIREK